MNTADSASHRDIQAWLESVREAPYRFDLWHLLRRIDAQHAEAPPLGRAPRPVFEPLRIGQEPSLAFAPTQIHAFERGQEAGPPRLTILGFGLFGPNGPLPIHLTEYARERLRSHGDRTFVRFCDLLHHRFTLLFYRAWADAQSTVSLDRLGDDSFSRYVASLIHLGDDTLRRRDAVPDHAKFFGAGHLARETRNAEGLQRLLEGFFGVRVRIEEWVAHWLALTPEQRTRLGAGRSAEQLGVGAVAGASVPDVQGKFRVRIGPQSLRDYEEHLPGGRFFHALLAWVRNYIGLELEWDARLVLKKDEVPSARLGASARLKATDEPGERPAMATRLGWTTWLGTRTRDGDADDLVLGHERWAQRVTASIH